MSNFFVQICTQKISGLSLMCAAPLLSPEMHGNVSACDP
jgi:hypothetical protein